MTPGLGIFQSLADFFFRSSTAGRKQTQHQAMPGLCILTCADSAFFFGLQIMVTQTRSIYPEIEITCADLGLTPEQRQWLTDNNVRIFDPSGLRRDLPHWHWWAKPQMIRQSGIRHVFWIDADAAVLNPIPEVMQHYEEHGLTLTTNRTEWRVRERQEAMHRAMNTQPVYNPLLNAGVLLLDTVRHAELLDTWIKSCEQISQDPSHTSYVLCGDQCVLQWLVDHRGYFAQHQLADYAYNWRPSPCKTTSIRAFLRSVERAQKQCKIMHLAGINRDFWRDWSL